MPQMAPMNWLLLFIIFSMTFYMYNIMNFYSYIPKIPKNKKMNFKKENTLNWKW